METVNSINSLIKPVVLMPTSCGKSWLPAKHTLLTGFGNTSAKGAHNESSQQSYYHSDAGVSISRINSDIAKGDLNIRTGLAGLRKPSRAQNISKSAP